MEYTHYCYKCYDCNNFVHVAKNEKQVALIYCKNCDDFFIRNPLGESYYRDNQWNVKL